jgi:hypothetical protein
VEYQDDFGIDNEQKEKQADEYGTRPSTQSTHTRVDTTAIKPTGTGCRTCAIFILLIGALAGFIYYYYQTKTQTPPTPDTAPSGQTQQK